MVGELFTMNTINVARAAEREASRLHRVSLSASLEITISSDGPGGDDLRIRVSTKDGRARDIPVSSAAVAACRQLDYPESRNAVTRLIDELASAIAAATQELQAVPQERHPTD